MTLAAGARVGPYEILGPIGAGGMGEVYRARDPRLGRDVAIKVLPASFSADADRLRRFEQEARAAGVLNHPNITAVYDIGFVDSAPYVVQELLEGETLRAGLAGGRLSPRKAIEYALQIAHGLGAAHEKGIVHRDLKPENLFVTRDGRVKILDFGLAKLTHQDEGFADTNLPTASAGTEPGVVLGTLGYMSPEQVRGKPADARSDIFSFGAILFEMLSGKRAFTGDSAADTMSAILKEDPPDLSLTNQSISPGLERIVRHCIEKNPEQRFHSAHDIAFALDTLTGVSAPSAVGPISAARPSASRRLLWITAVLGVAALAAAGIHLATRARPGEPPTFRQVTFRRGVVNSARFAPDGQTLVYGAAWEGTPNELYQARIGVSESRPIGVPRAERVLGVSASGDMAVKLRTSPPMLGRVPITGGAAREVSEDILDADISRDGRSFAIVRWIGGGFQLEYPIGKTLLKTSGMMTDVRISPDGERVAFFDNPLIGDDRGSLAVITRDGKKTALTKAWASARGIAWSSSGQEIWFTAADRGANLIVHAVTLDGRVRRVLPGPGRLILHDIAPDGRLLLEKRTLRRALMCQPRGQKQERDLSWLDDSNLAALSRDGSFLVIGETGEGGGQDYGVFLRKTDGSPAVRLGDGVPDSLSPDERWVTVLAQGPSPKIVLLPIGAGEPRTLPDFGIQSRMATLLRDGKQVLLFGAKAGAQSRLFLGNIETGTVRPFGPETIAAPGSVSPDGKLVFAVGPEPGRAFVYPLDGGEPRPITPFEEGEWSAGWSADSRFVFLFSTWQRPLRVWRVDVSNGKRELWKEVPQPDATGEGMLNFAVASDGQSYGYSYSRALSELFVVEGLR